MVRASQRILSCRTYERNDKAFHHLTDEAAYWVGFLMSDGSISDRHQKSMMLRVILNKRDIEHLVKLADFLGVARSKVRINRSRPDRASFALNDDSICSKLCEYGVTPRKSFTKDAHESVRMNRHFWRGVIDGDGTVSIHCGYTPRLLLTTASEVLAKQYQTWMLSVGVQTKLFIDNAFRVQVYGLNAYRAIHHMYYGDIGKISLDRKREKAQLIVSTFEQRYKSKLANDV